MRKRARLRKKLPNLNLHDKRLVQGKIDKIDEALVNSATAELHNKESKAVESIKYNPKFFYKYAFSKSKIQSPSTTNLSQTLKK